jgi:hypothetical protein
MTIKSNAMKLMIRWECDISLNVICNSSLGEQSNPECKDMHHH